MSLASWKKEFYRIPADMVSKRNALRHSLRKWTGLLYKNRRKHKVELYDGTLYDDERNELDIDAESCSLCFVYNGECRNCPLKDCHSKFHSLLNRNLANPMVKLIASKIKGRK